MDDIQVFGNRFIEYVISAKQDLMISAGAKIGMESTEVEGILRLNDSSIYEVQVKEAEGDISHIRTLLVLSQKGNFVKGWTVSGIIKSNPFTGDPQFQREINPIPYTLGSNILREILSQEDTEDMGMVENKRAH